MGKIRKILAVVFGCLSAIFALIALRNTLSEHARDTNTAAASSCDWGFDIESAARREGKLVFLKSEKLSHFNPPPNIKKILSQNYISAEICAKKFPADIAIIDYILSAATKRKSRFEAGIFSPNLIPVYMTSRAESKCGRFAPNLEKAIEAAAAQFQRNPDTLKSSARAAARIADAPSDFSISADNFKTSGCLRFLNAESARLFIYFNSPQTLNEDAAILSENARLVSRIGSADIRQIAARSAAVSAAEMLCARLSAKSESTTSKLLFLRALGESEYILKNEKMNSYYLHYAKFSAENADAEGYFNPSKEKPLVRDNALAVSVLLKTFEITNDAEYLKRAEKISENLAALLELHGIMPASIGEKSEASALEYVLCARAFFDMSKFSDERKWSRPLRAALNELDKYFMTDLGVWSINSANSAFAKFSRMIFTKDANLPSYVGEAAQLFAEMEQFQSRPAQEFQRLAAAAASASPLMNHQWASLKLSLVPSFRTHRHSAKTGLWDSGIFKTKALPCARYGVSTL